MKNCTHDITLFHVGLDHITGYDMLTKSYIYGVSLAGAFSVNVSKEGLSSANLFTIRIPGSEVLTIKEGDIIIEGTIDPAQMNVPYLERGYPCMYVVSVTDNRGKREPHYKVVCR